MSIENIIKNLTYDSNYRIFNPYKIAKFLLKLMENKFKIEYKNNSCKWKFTPSLEESYNIDSKFFRYYIIKFYIEELKLQLILHKNKSEILLCEKFIKYISSGKKWIHIMNNIELIIRYKNNDESKKTNKTTSKKVNKKNLLENRYKKDLYKLKKNNPKYTSLNNNIINLSKPNLTKNFDKCIYKYDKEKTKDVEVTKLNKENLFNFDKEKTKDVIIKNKEPCKINNIFNEFISLFKDDTKTDKKDIMLEGYSKKESVNSNLFQNDKSLKMSKEYSKEKSIKNNLFQNNKDKIHFATPVTSTINKNIKYNHLLQFKKRLSHKFIYVNHIKDIEDELYTGSFFDCIEKLMRYLYLNPNVPLNHNVYISDIFMNNCFIYEDFIWKNRNTNIIVNALYKDLSNIIEFLWLRKIEKPTNDPLKILKNNNLKILLKSKESDILVKKMKDKMKTLLYLNKCMILRNFYYK